MELQIFEKPDLVQFVKNLIDHYPVEGVKRKGQSVYGESFFYGTINSPDELTLDFDCTVMPPKKYFLPPKEELLYFTVGPSPEAKALTERETMVLFGVHPYDLKAINQMDQIFAEGNPDPHYLKRRKAVLIIGIDPRNVAKRSFWSSMEAASVSSGFDLMLTEIDDGYVVEVGSERGKDLLNRHGKVHGATREQIMNRLEARSRAANLCRNRELAFPMREIPQLLQHSLTNGIWEENASKCLSCGTCNLVCPTCYCFDVWDEMELDLINGRRLRRWDGCLLSDFARVASGENFRETRTSRYQHRIFRKGQYLVPKLNDMACVGCGRCASSCLPDIADPVNLLNRLKEEAQ